MKTKNLSFGYSTFPALDAMPSDATQETRAQKFERLEKLENCIRSLYMDIPCQPTPEFITYIKQFVK